MPKLTDYSIAQKSVHWLMATLIILDLFIAQKFGDPMEILDRIESRSDHGTLGAITAILFVFASFYVLKMEFQVFLVQCPKRKFSRLG